MSVGVMTTVDLTPYMDKATYDTAENDKCDVADLADAATAMPDVVAGAVPVGIYATAITFPAAAVIKKIQFIVGRTGTYRVAWEATCTEAAGYARVYKNGATHGTAKYPNSGGWEAATEDLAFVAGDLLEIWGNGAAGTAIQVKNIEISIGATSVTPSMAWELYNV